MIHLNKRERSESYLALLKVYGITDRDLDRPTSDKMKRIGFAELVSFVPSQVRRVQSIVNALTRQRLAQERAGKTAKYFTVCPEMLGQMLGSSYLAQLALNCAGYWTYHDAGLGQTETGDCGAIGGARTELVLPDCLYTFTVDERCAA